MGNRTYLRRALALLENGLRQRGRQFRCARRHRVAARLGRLPSVFARGARAYTVRAVD